MSDADTPGHTTPDETEDHKSDKYPYIRPKDLRPAEPLAVDAEDIEDFIEHFAHHDDHEKAHKSARSRKLADQAGKALEEPPGGP